MSNCDRDRHNTECSSTALSSSFQIELQPPIDMEYGNNNGGRSRSNTTVCFFLLEAWSWWGNEGRLHAILADQSVVAEVHDRVVSLAYGCRRAIHNYSCVFLKKKENFHHVVMDAMSYKYV